jgi:hypothetical protein
MLMSAYVTKKLPVSAYRQFTHDMAVTETR